MSTKIKRTLWIVGIVIAVLAADAIQPNRLVEFVLHFQSLGQLEPNIVAGRIQLQGLVEFIGRLGVQHEMTPDKSSKEVGLG